MKKTSKHQKKKLEVIPKPKSGTRTVLEPKSNVVPVIKGVGNLDLLCGSCGETLVDGIDEGQIRNIVIRCPKCGAYNEIPP